MTLPIYRLRRLLGLTAVLFALVVVGMYVYARLRTRDVRKDVPNKIGYDIKQTANGFQFSKSDGKRTLFTVQASDIKQFKLNDRAELHNVSIVLYGRDSSRFDQIYGDDFSYDSKTGDVTAKGEVQIDLVANPAGIASPDQSTPKELKNPIHLKTRDLVFNRETGNASTDARVEFSTPQATGSAVGVKYMGKSNLLTLSSQIHLVLSGENAATIDAEHGIITSDPHEITLDRPRLDRDGGTMLADRAVFHLTSDNQVEQIVATGNVNTVTRSSSHPAKVGGNSDPASKDAGAEMHGRADEADFWLAGKRDELRTATLIGNVHFEQTGPQPMLGDAGRVILDFAGENQLQRVHAIDGAHLAQKADEAKKPGSNSSPQDFDLTAPVIDFTVVQGHILQRATTSGDAKITISSTPGPAAGPTPSPAQLTVVTADKFDAKFAIDQGRNHLSAVHGVPNARVLSSTTGQPDRTSTSESIDATFLPQGGIEAITQQGNVAFSDNQGPDKRMQAWADNARYTPTDQMLVLSGSPRVTNGGMTTTSKTIRINRANGDALAEGDVKSTYSDLKEQPNGALLASSSPIHVTARTMTAQHNSGLALYSGNARLWQDANIIEAPTIQFDRDHRSVTAQGIPAHPVQTILVQTEKPQAENAGTAKIPQKKAGKNAGANGSSPLAIMAAQLTYTDAERKIHYEGGVAAKSADFTAQAKTVDAYLLPRSQTSGNQSVAGPGQLDHMVAQDNVVIRQPNRRAEGQKLVYTASDDKFVLTGGPPSIFDAEQGKITGVSLTFFRRDDRVLVEGEAGTPVVTTTRVAR
jgi:lipopolysaccharide export system protein LptA